MNSGCQFQSDNYKIYPEAYIAIKNTSHVRLSD